MEESVTAAICVCVCSILSLCLRVLLQTWRDGLGKGALAGAKETRLVLASLQQQRLAGTAVQTVKHVLQASLLMQTRPPARYTQTHTPRAAALFASDQARVAEAEGGSWSSTGFCRKKAGTIKGKGEGGVGERINGKFGKDCRRPCRHPSQGSH